VDGADLAAVLAAWGFDVPEVEQSGDNLIDGQDLGIVLGAWGLPCDLPDDPGVCGDGTCDAGETADCCPVDCASNCPEGTTPDCDGSGECWPTYWIGDGYCDGTAQEWGANLCCYDNDGGDCTLPECSSPCGDGICGITENFFECPLDCENPCGDASVPDCDGSGECWDETWIGDGYCDGTDQLWEADLCCYDNDGGDCPVEECQ
ncbi:MAG: hypothetical protein VYB77_04090, partial [Planctomycetota bacterium]|nr:hypothetical protein [Planctomycetota bacterium]